MIIGSRDSELVVPDQQNTDSAKLKRDFDSLAAEWNEQGKYLSSPTASGVYCESGSARQVQVEGMNNACGFALGATPQAITSLAPSPSG